MPQVPVYRRQVSERVNASAPRANISIPEGAFGGNEARNAAVASDAADKWADAIGRVEKQQRTVESEKLYNDFITEDRKRLQGTGEGYLEVSGVDTDEKGKLKVSGGSARYFKESNDSFEEFLRTNVSDSRVADSVRQKMMSYHRNNIFAIDSYESSQLKQAVEASDDAAMARIKLSWVEAKKNNDTNTLHLIGGENGEFITKFNEIAERKGWTGDVYTAELMKRQYSLDRDYLYEQVKVDPKKAHDYYTSDVVNGGYSAEQSANLEKILKQGTLNYYSGKQASDMERADESMSVDETLSDADRKAKILSLQYKDAEANKFLDAKQKLALKQEANSYWNVIDAQRQAIQSETYQEFMGDIVLNGKYKTSSEAKTAVGAISNSRLNQDYKKRLNGLIDSVFKLTPEQQKKQRELQTARLYSIVERQRLQGSTIYDTYAKVMLEADKQGLPLANTKLIADRLVAGSTENRNYKQVEKIFKQAAEEGKLGMYSAKSSDRNPEDEEWKNRVINRILVGEDWEQIRKDPEAIMERITEQSYGGGFFDDDIDENLRENEFKKASDDMINYRDKHGWGRFGSVSEYMQSDKYLNTVSDVNRLVRRYNENADIKMPYLRPGSKYTALAVSTGGVNISNDWDPTQAKVSNIAASWYSLHQSVVDEGRDTNNWLMFQDMRSIASTQQEPEVYTYGEK